MVSVEGFEPSTSRFQGEHSAQAELYTGEFGEGGWNRTNSVAVLETAALPVSYTDMALNVGLEPTTS